MSNKYGSADCPRFSLNIRDEGKGKSFGIQDRNIKPTEEKTS